MKKLFILLSLLPQFALAQLVPISESELAGTVGQAFINIDHTSSSGLDFTKVSLGLDIKTSLNSSLLELGRYERSGEAFGSSDIRISDFALGHIDSNGNIIPFRLIDPFIELAFDDSRGSENLVGIRLGFGGALGKLSGNIESMTGNVDVSIIGLGRDLAPHIQCEWWQFDCHGAKLLVGTAWANSEFKAKAYLTDSGGNSDPIRATQIGMLNGQSLSLPGNTEFENFLLSLFTAQNCGLFATLVCFPTQNFKSLDIGDNGAPSEGLFLSFQTQTVTWQDASTSTAASEGSFLNIPNGGINVSFGEAFGGIPRARTKYVDPYFGGF